MAEEPKRLKLPFRYDQPQFNCCVAFTDDYDFERKMTRIYNRGLVAEKLLSRWSDWARAHGHDIGILDDTREFLARKP